MRDAVEKVGSELFTMVHRPEEAGAVSWLKDWRALQDSNLRPLVRSQCALSGNISDFWSDIMAVLFDTQMLASS